MNEPKTLSLIPANRQGASAVTYRKCDFGKELLAQLEKGCDPDRIARWANEQHLNHAGEMDDGLRSEIQTVMFMEGDSQFHLNERELRLKTGQVRQWMESYNHTREVTRVHPKMIDGQAISSPHYPPKGGELAP